MTDNRGLPRFPYVMFDLGGTLIYFEGSWPDVMAESIHAVTHLMRSWGYNLDARAFPEAYFDLIQQYYQKRSDKFLEYTSEHVLREALLAHNCPVPTDEQLQQALKVMYGVSQQYWRVEPDAIPCLEALRARGCRLGIVSNAADDADVQTLVDNAQLRPYFDFILTSAVAGVRKPNPRIFQDALAQWGAKPEQAVMVGDTVAADIAGANGVGIASIWIPRRQDTPDNHSAARQHCPDATVSALSQIPELLETWQ
jgi:HAD superfamily hydrolase (TIGR01549 family)